MFYVHCLNPEARKIRRPKTPPNAMPGTTAKTGAAHLLTDIFARHCLKQDGHLGHDPSLRQTVLRGCWQRNLQRTHSTPAAGTLLVGHKQIHAEDGVVAGSASADEQLALRLMTGLGMSK
jgi:hypothetical protein